MGTGILVLMVATLAAWAIYVFNPVIGRTIGPWLIWAALLVVVIVWGTPIEALWLAVVVLFWLVFNLNSRIDQISAALGIESHTKWRFGLGHLYRRLRAAAAITRIKQKNPEWFNPDGTVKPETSPAQEERQRKAQP